MVAVMSARPVRRWARAGLQAARPLLLLLALFPSLSYMGHWTELFAPEAASGAAEQEDHSGHEAHCHFGPANCAEQPVPPNTQSLPDLVELSNPELNAVPLEDTTAIPEEVYSRPPVQPPRA